MEIPRIARLVVTVDVAATLADGNPASLAGVDLALCPQGGPTASTVWIAGQYDDVAGKATVTICGPDAANLAAALILVLPRMELWARDVDNPEVIAGQIDWIERPA